MVRAVIFDLFGTLVDMFPFQEYERVLSEMANVLSVPLDDFQRLWGETFNERATGDFPTIEVNIEYICWALGMNVEAAQIEEASRIRFDFTRRSLTPRDDAVETLNLLRSAGHKIGLISDCTPEVPVLWPDTPFAELVDAALFSATVGIAKPDPRIYRLACEQLGVVPEICLYVGDGSSHELTGASKFGMRAVLIRVPYEEDYDYYRPDAKKWKGPVISTLKDVLKFSELTQS